MNLEKFTDRAKGFLQSAQTVAIRLSHQRISPEHLLKALLEDNEGMASGLIQRAGGNPKAAVEAVDQALAQFARSYADQTEADHARLVKAVRRGQLPVTEGALDKVGSAFRP